MVFDGPKNKWWIPPIEAPLLIIGDSQLTTLQTTLMPFPSVQIACYPGANGRSLFNILHKSASSAQPLADLPATIIISLGINHRDWAEATSAKEVKKFVSKCRRYWPRAHLHFCVANYLTKALSPTQTLNMQTFNKELMQNVPLHDSASLIAPLPDAEFHVQRDGLHWSRPTAQAMLMHWHTALVASGTMYQPN
jgi:hypothetical protein